ncbi:DEAD/DEAH box helicase [Shewanella livingstonensis]|uniref:DEAD/DEAH box helicase n=1 Tax=Shewanella livingstonensis TaxID=150120 RepID=A0A3G8LRE3_9GAMM|nr:DEAD/DEAH box helicase [Shewanella livingstonensis]AZG72119.1 DEAD/DEAH box helicase [Shewanella livingstonensis]
MSFADLSLHSTLTDRLAELNYQQPTPIQIQAIPVILSGKDVMAGAQTGTGKTAAFALPLLQHILSKRTVSIPLDLCAENVSAKAVISCLVLVPTRELAQQVQSSIEQYAKGSDIGCVMVYGGVSIGAQIKQLAAGTDILVATPGRLLDLLRKRALSLSQLTHLVFDEADRMLDMGFKDEIVEVLKCLPSTRQTLLFSATLDDRMLSFSRRLLRSPQVIEVAQRNTTASSIVERVFNVDANRKCAMLCHLITTESWQQSLIFCRTKQGADVLVKQMKQAGVAAEAFHADLTQAMREQVLAAFKAGDIIALVATDVAARGLDINELNYVVNMELPFQVEDYVHRIGRTGRAGKQGQAITLLSVDDEPLLTKLEAFLDRRLPQQWLAGFEPDLDLIAPVTRKTTKSALKQQARKKALAASSRGKKR